MPGQTAPDDAARLEVALERIARAAAHAQDAATRAASLPEPAPRATTPPAAAVPEGVTARLDALIADLRAVLGTQV